MQIELHQREEMRGPATDGLLLGLWIGEVCSAAEYWVLRSAHLALRVVRGVFLRPLRLAAIVGAPAIALAAVNVGNKLADAKMQTAQIQGRTLEIGAELYLIDHGHWPARVEELTPRYVRWLPVDPWNRPYALYRGETSIAFVSAGPDGALGTSDDIVVVGQARK